MLPLSTSSSLVGMTLFGTSSPNPILVQKSSNFFLSVNVSAADIDKLLIPHFNSSCA